MNNEEHSPFPIIESISDVLPAISGRKEFSVTEKGDYKVICYNLSLPDSFDCPIRRECRGLIFDSVTGKIISRPFEKFHNVNEREDTQLNVIQPLFDDSHQIFQKVDGSMIRVFMTSSSDVIRFGTKKGETDVSARAESFARKTFSPGVFDWVRMLIDHEITPIFEWISPDDQIVIDYQKEDLILLACRNNITGHYYDINTLDAPGEITHAQTLNTGDSFSSINDLVDYTKDLKNEEGFVVFFPAVQKRVKIKAEEYLRIHKVKEMISQDRHLIRLAIDNKLDDLITVLPQDSYNACLDRVALFWKFFQKKVMTLLLMTKEINAVYGNDMKRISLEYMPNKDKRTVAILFQIIRSGVSVDNQTVLEKHIHQILLEHIITATDRTETAFQRLNDWFTDEEKMSC